MRLHEAEQAYDDVIKEMAVSDRLVTAAFQRVTAATGAERVSAHADYLKVLEGLGDGHAVALDILAEAAQAASRRGEAIPKHILSALGESID